MGYISVSLNTLKLFTMMRFLVISFALLPFIAIAQDFSDYQPGFYINNDGDTVRGFIKYDWLANSYKFPPKFQSSMTGVPNQAKLDAAKVSQIVVDEVHSLVSWPVKLSHKTENKFLYKVISGSYELYELGGVGGKPNKIYFLRKAGEQNIVRINHHNLDRFIRSVFQDCSSVVEKAGSYHYHLSSLTGLLEDASNCLGQNATIKSLKPQREKQTFFWAEGSYGLGWYSISGYYEDANGLRAMGFGVGAGIEKRSKKLGYGIGFYFDHSQRSAKNIGIHNRLVSKITNLDITINRLQLVPYIQYWIPAKKISVIPELGLINNFYFASRFEDENLTAINPYDGLPFVPKYEVEPFDIGIRPGISMRLQFLKTSSFSPAFE